jgi:cell division protein FtsB
MNAFGGEHAGHGRDEESVDVNVTINVNLNGSPSGSGGGGSIDLGPVEGLVNQALTGIKNIITTLGGIVTVQDEINAAIAGDEAAIKALGERVTTQETALEAKNEALTTANTALEATITGLKSTIATLEANQVDVTGLKAHLAELEAQAKKIAEAPASTEPVKPAEGGGGTPTTTLNTQSVYTFTPTATMPSVDTSAWQEVPFVTTDGAQLYYYLGDTAGSTPFTTAGEGHEGWALYTGEVKAKV